MLEARLLCAHCKHPLWDHQSRQTWDGACNRCLCHKFEERPNGREE